ncbi:MAG: glycosyltransferase family 39 protein [Verrucomicrobia bacterium]|nr:glycosyltransferase family 39 protein [Verrucomicrobiota bacterium]
MTVLADIGRRLSGPLGAGLLLFVLYVALLAGGRDKSPAMDEPLHAAAGHAYWRFGDFRIHPENGVLPQRWFGLALLGDSINPPDRASPSWRESRQWSLAYEWFHHSGNDPATLLRRGRAAAALLTVALGALVWWWSRSLFGPAGGLLSLALFALDPTILAHGALLTSDLCGALFFLLSLWTASRALEAFTPGRLLASTLALSGLFLSKMSAPLVLPVLALLLGARLLSPAPLPLGVAPPLTSRRARALALAAGVILHLAVVFGAIWLAYGFRFTAFAAGPPGPAQFDYPWEWALDRPDHIALVNQLDLTPDQTKQVAAVLAQHGAGHLGWDHAAVAALAEVRRTVLRPEQARTLARLLAAPPPALPTRAVEFARRHRLLPEAFLYGYAHVWKLSRSRTAFLNGGTSQTGWRSFFPFTFLVKTPLVLHLLALLAVPAAVARWRRARRSDPAHAAALLHSGVLPLAAFAAVYGGAAILSHLNIGHRHLLPLYPVLFILCGATAWWLQPVPAATRPRLFPPVWLAAPLGVLVIETAAWFPHYLSYFNGLVRPSRAYRHLVDSSLDWGQDLPGLRRYLDRHPPAGRSYLAYFGMGRPTYYGITATQFYGHLGFEVVAQPALRVLPDLQSDRDRAKIAEFLRNEPVYDPALLANVEFGATRGALLVKRPDALRLAGGTYFISATLLQPVTYSTAFGPWNAQHEAAYQRLRETVRPLLDDDVRVRAAALGQHSMVDWLRAFDDYAEYRFARLTAFLRQREPADTINYSILVYHLTDADLTRALDGPPPK